jgi:glycyl-tRNA synthetase alpha subunit
MLQETSVDKNDLEKYFQWEVIVMPRELNLEVIYLHQCDVTESLFFYVDCSFIFLRV